MRKILHLGSALVLGLVIAACATDNAVGPDDTLRPSMAVTFDPATGLGFVGKGDVQYTFGWNNKQLQDNANDVRFRAVTSSVTEVSWTCTNSNNQKEQIRERTTTTSTQGVLSSIGRLKNQITGFNLLGWSGPPVVSGPTTEGPPLNSCPEGPWSLTEAAGEPVDLGSSSTFEVSGDNGATWTELLEKP